jgi:hypothetical protein
MSKVRIALACGLLLIVAALAVTLGAAPMVVIHGNGVSEQNSLLETRLSTSVCQAGEAIPANTTAVRLGLDAQVGPKVTVAVSAGGRTITTGTAAGGWGGGVVTVPVRAVRSAASNTEICFTLAPAFSTVTLVGEGARLLPAIVLPANRPLPGRIAVEYLHRGSSSWLSLLPSIAHRMGLGHAWPGAWIVFVLASAMAFCLALVARAGLRELR